MTGNQILVLKKKMALVVPNLGTDEGGLDRKHTLPKWKKNIYRGFSQEVSKLIQPGERVLVHKHLLTAAHVQFPDRILIGLKADFVIHYT